MASISLGLPARWDRVEDAADRRCSPSPDFSILRFAYPEVNVAGCEVFAAYATRWALNGILPANLGTFVPARDADADHSRRDVRGHDLRSMPCRRSSSSLIGAFPYLYLFLTVGGSFDIKFKFVKSHPWATAVLLADRRRCC